MENNSTPKAKEKRLIKKTALIIAAVALSLAAVLGALYAVKSFLNRDKFDYKDENSSIYFFPADYDANPEEDAAYMAMNRDVWFSDDGGTGGYLDSADGESDSIKGLMYRYFKSLKEGDATAHEALLSDYYKANYVVQEKFTCQKVHDITVTFNQGDLIDGIYRWYFRVSYEIYENNGTYRTDIGSETPRVMSFEVIYEDNGYKINSIGYITAKQ